MRTLLIVLVIAQLAMATAASAGATPAQVCQSSKNKLAGQYDYCRQKVESKFALTGDGAARTTALTKCLDKYNLKWPPTESKAGGACPSVGDQAAIQAAVAAETANLATALGGGPLENLATCEADLGTCNGSLTTCSTNLTNTQASLTTCTGNLGTCNTNLTTCQNDLTICQAVPQAQPLKTGQFTCWDSIGNVISCSGTGHDGELQKGLARAYVDNGDGTISDTRRADVGKAVGRREHPRPGQRVHVGQRVCGEGREPERWGRVRGVHGLASAKCK
jgi:hypothetical protein